MFTVITRNGSNAVDSFETPSLIKAKAWGKAQLKNWNVNNASIFSDGYNFKSLHASVTNGVVRWKASKI
jgi:hypothetical protein